MCLCTTVTCTCFLCSTVTGFCVTMYVLQLPVQGFLYYSYWFMCLGITVTCTCFLCTSVTGLCVYVMSYLFMFLCTTVTGLYVYVLQLHVPRRYEVKCLGHFIDKTFHRQGHFIDMTFHR